MQQQGTLLAAIGQSIEFVGAIWLLFVAWRAKQGRGKESGPMTYADVPKLHQRMAASGYGGAAITVALGLVCAVVGGWMQV
ncbi:hypothetical protein [Actinoplanes sp. NPDC051411]|uniref:hypothetical protein n=1 Tax=Actinoplanes sp. NPDC051411 TaxID=3155522 RepID=UPI003420BC18